MRQIFHVLGIHYISSHYYNFFFIVVNTVGQTFGNLLWRTIYHKWAETPEDMVADQLMIPLVIAQGA